MGFFMPIYMTHEDHGTHICYDEFDAAKHEALGWKRVEDKPKQPEKPRRGRPRKDK